MAAAEQPAKRGSADLLPWSVTAEQLVAPPPPPAAAQPPLELSVVDRIAVPTAFLHQTFVFEQALDADRLGAALAEVLALLPTLSCCANKGQDGEWALAAPGAGALLTLGTSAAALQRLAPLPLPPLAPQADLGGELFGHLPPTLPASDPAAAAATPLLQVALFAALAAKPPLQALTLHVSAARLAALKEQAMAELAAAGSTADAAGDGQQGTCAGAWVSSNDALMAWLWKALAALPCRRGAVTPFNLALDMRSRMQLPTAHPTLPRWVYGNLATSAFCPELDAAALPLGQVALALRQTVVSDAGKFAGDVAYATQHAASGGSCSALAILPVLRILEAASAGQVPVLMASQWALDHARDVDFGGQLPLAAAASFGSALMFPVAVSQAAPPAAGGGIMLHLWLWPDEARELTAALMADTSWA
ncbi:trichothecene 3-O-acetyltransferase [Micractinium conductrix]|uniref:Trichothecene 3-O-acetyltransferase n=1 Tax=Micractinium conductrix TaxID=554055 RepID=A0A2P6V9A9_9CHLO|nr:trichothecene 3-O-acetyltransferase [Micractinium conductrix]|eukprot:PSC70669.1 trichothecene 3-O-acetyltransferase [Micractinium conductrix]